MVARSPRTDWRRTFAVLPGAGRNATNGAWVWLHAAVVDRLAAMRRRSESFNDVILRLVELESRREVGQDNNLRRAIGPINCN